MNVYLFIYWFPGDSLLVGYLLYLRLCVCVCECISVCLYNVPLALLADLV